MCIQINYFFGGIYDITMLPAVVFLIGVWLVYNIFFDSPRSAPHDQDASGSKVGPNDDRNAEICATHAPCMEYLHIFT